MHNDTNTSSNWGPSTCRLPRAGRVQEGAQKARSVLTSCPTCLPRASAGGAAVVGAAETTLLPPMRSQERRQARRGEELTCKYWLKLCKSFCAAGNTYSLPEHCVRSHGQRDLSPTASHIPGSDSVSLSNLFSCNTFLQKMQPKYWAMTGLKKKKQPTNLLFGLLWRTCRSSLSVEGSGKKKVVGAIVD